MRDGADAARSRTDALTLALFGVVGTLVGTLGGGSAGVEGTLDPAVVLAIVAMVAQASGFGTLDPVTRRVLCLACVTALAADGRLAMVGLTVGALAMLRHGMRDPKGAAGLLWLSVAWHVLWAKAAFKLVSDRVIGLEVPLVADVGRIAIPGLSVDGTVISNGGWYVHVVEGCSAFHGLSLALLACVATASLTGTRVDGRTWAGLAVACLAVVAVNVARIVAMLPSSSAYGFWHDGPGGLTAVALTAMLGTLPVLLGTRSR